MAQVVLAGTRSVVLLERRTLQSSGQSTQEVDAQHIKVYEVLCIGITGLDSNLHQIMASNGHRYRKFSHGLSLVQ